MLPNTKRFTVSCFLICSFILCFAMSGENRGDDWPQWRGVKRDGAWSEKGIVTEFADAQIEVKWRQKIGAGYSGPTVADGRVYITDRQVEPEQVESIHCFDEKSGRRLWTKTYKCEYSGIGYTAGPRAAVTVDTDDNRVYALGAMGHIHCLDPSGVELWSRDLNSDLKIKMPIWGIAASPLIYDDLVILHIGGAEACIVALDKKSGETEWQSLRERASYSAPILIEQGGQPVVVCWTGDSLSGLDPENGKVFWRHAFPPSRMPIGISTPVVDGDLLFVTSFYDGSLMMQLDQTAPRAKVLWQRRGRNERATDALHSIISTPCFLKGHVYGVDSYGELRCLDGKTGDRVWEDQTATPRARWSNIHFVQNGERTWMFNERGELLIADLSPQGFKEISRAKLIKPTLEQLRRRDGVCWAHPAFANKCVFIRNDEEILCASLEAK